MKIFNSRYLCAFVAAVLFTPTVVAGDHPFETVFKEVRDTPVGTYAIYRLTNAGDQDIDDVKLALKLETVDGDYLASMASTDQTPGLVWLAAGASKEVGVPADAPEVRKLLEADPDQAKLVVEVKELTYMQ